MNNPRIAALRRSIATTTAQGNQHMAQGKHDLAERLFEQALSQWRKEGGPKDEEGPLILSLGKSMVAQRKYEPAYELYMQALNYLTGAAYDDVYSSFLYLNERMGTFTKKEQY